MSEPTILTTSSDDAMRHQAWIESGDATETAIEDTRTAALEALGNPTDNLVAEITTGLLPLAENSTLSTKENISTHREHAKIVPRAILNFVPPNITHITDNNIRSFLTQYIIGSIDAGIRDLSGEIKGYKEVNRIESGNSLIQSLGRAPLADLTPEIISKLVAKIIDKKLNFIDKHRGNVVVKWNEVFMQAQTRFTEKSLTRKMDDCGVFFTDPTLGAIDYLLKDENSTDLRYTLFYGE